MSDGEESGTGLKQSLAIDMTDGGKASRVRFEGRWLAPGAWTDIPPRFDCRCFVWFLASRRAYLVDLFGEEIHYVDGRGTQPLVGLVDVLWARAVSEPEG